MTRKIIKYILSGALLIFLCYNAVYFKKLDEVKKEAIVTKFDAIKFAAKYYKEVLPGAAKSIEYNALLSLLKTNPDKAFADHAHALGIGNIKYFLVQGKGKIQAVNESSITVLIKSDSAQSTTEIATEFVYGNAIRDASGLIKLKEFSSTADLNNVSSEVNRIVREKVLPPFLSKAKAGDAISFSGAIELNKKYLNTNGIEIIPIQISITQ
jgi:predicted lipoprotein